MVFERKKTGGAILDYRKREIFSSTQRPKRKIRISFRIPFLPYIKTAFYVCILLAVFYFLVFSQVFSIKNVEIEGAKSVEMSDYINKNLLGKNIIVLAPGKFLSSLTEEYPIIEEANIVRGLPSTVRVSVTERKQLLIWCSLKCFEIDTKGVAYQETERPKDKIFLTDKSNIEISSGQQVASENFIDFYLKAADQLDQMELNPTESYIEDTTFKLIFKTKDGWNVIFDTSESLDNQIEALKQVLEKNRSDIKEYVDVRVEGVAYIK